MTGGVRGVATSTSFRRWVAKTLVRQFGKAVEAVCAPYQFALSVHRRRSSVYRVFSINGVVPAEVAQHAVCRGLLPFVRSVHARPTTHVWEDGTGARHQIRKQRGANKETPSYHYFSVWAFTTPFAQQMRGLDQLDDVHVVSPPPHRTRDGCNILEERNVSTRRRIG